jgi:hypothetical protein
MIHIMITVLKALSSSIPRYTHGSAESITDDHGGWSSGRGNGIRRGPGTDILGKRGVTHTLWGSAWITDLATDVVTRVAATSSPDGEGARTWNVDRAAERAVTVAIVVIRNAKRRGTLVMVGSHIKLFWASNIEMSIPKPGGSTH